MGLPDAVFWLCDQTKVEQEAHSVLISQDVLHESEVRCYCRLAHAAQVSKPTCQSGSCMRVRHITWPAMATVMYQPCAPDVKLLPTALRSSPGRKMTLPILDSTRQMAHTAALFRSGLAIPNRGIFRVSHLHQSARQHSSLSIALSSIAQQLPSDQSRSSQP